MTTKTKPKTVGQRVKAWREKKGLSLAKLARMADMDARTLRSIENDLRKPWGESLKKIAVALDVDVAQLDPDAK